MYWKTVYDQSRYNVGGRSCRLPAFAAAASVLFAAECPPISKPNTVLQKGSLATDRIASCWYSPSSFNVDLRFNDSNPHQVALYLLDWDNFTGGRLERVDILDANNMLLDSRNVSNFVNGEYLEWNLSGHVIVRITNTNAAANAVLSGIFFR
jgi:hypothetical protein